MSEKLVVVENLSKKFCRDLKKSLWYGVKDITAQVIGRSPKTKLRDKEFWAIQDINFELKRGEALGIIGPNGAGKSTLLKLLTGLIKPNTGSVTMKGRVQALIELGAGFNPILTGRENIYINAAVLGIPKKVIDSKLDEIIEFAEIEEFIDTPVQSYSSGMRVKLGFSVAINVEPDILIVDEVLAVGDLAFQKKAMRKMAETRDKAGAIIFVSHSMASVRTVCNTGLLIHQDTKPVKRDLVDTISEYYRLSARNTAKDTISVGVLVLENWYLSSGKDYINYGENIEIVFEVKCEEEYDNLDITTGIVDKNNSIVIGFNSTERRMAFIKLQKGLNKFSVNFGKCSLLNGSYTPSLAIRSKTTSETLLRVNTNRTFEVKGSGVGMGVIDADFSFKAL